MRYPSRKEIYSKRTAKGGWRKADLAEWGVAWPPPKGWKDNLELKHQLQQLRQGIARLKQN